MYATYTTYTILSPRPVVCEHVARAVVTTRRCCDQGCGALWTAYVIHIHIYDTYIHGYHIYIEKCAPVAICSHTATSRGGRRAAVTTRRCCDHGCGSSGTAWVYNTILLRLSYAMLYYNYTTTILYTIFYHILYTICYILYTIL